METTGTGDSLIHTDSVAAFSGDDAQYFKLAPEYRRCGIYISIASLTLILIAGWIDFGQGRAWFDRLGLYGFLSSIAGFGLWLHWWRLRVTAEGIARRRFFRWDMWPWDAFETAQIRKSFRPFTYQWPARPWWSRKLTLQLTGEADAKRLGKVIDAVMLPPPAAEPPSEATIRYAFRKRVQFDSDGVRLFIKDDERSYSWTDVRRLRIWRLDRHRHDFRELELELPDHRLSPQVRSHQGGALPSWRGPDAETLSALLLRYVPPERVDVWYLNEPPTSLDDWQSRMDRLRTQGKDILFLKRIRWLGTAFLLAVCVGGGHLGVYVSTAMALVLIWPTYQHFINAYNKKVAELELQRPVGEPLINDRRPR